MMMMFMRALTSDSMISACRSSSVPPSMSEAIVSLSVLNFLMSSVGWSTEIGLDVAFTREPSKGAPGR